ncbi:Blue-light photoreceptor [Nymphaea thermarum]|nr:Blue-light photoreceptor [Nymphaea thermarum]
MENHHVTLSPEKQQQQQQEVDQQMQQQEQEHHHDATALLPFGSLSLSLSSAVSLPKTTIVTLSSPTASFKPAFVSATPNLTIRSSLSSSLYLNPAPSPIRRNSALKSAFSSATIATPLRHRPDNSDSSPGGVCGRRTTIVWFRNDLRVHDNEALSSADSESLSLLPVYVFDPRDYGKSPSGFDRTGPYRATFVLQAVADLRQSLKKRGSDLVVRIGRPEKVLVELARNVGAEAVFAHREVAHEEVKTEAAVEAALAEEGVETKWFWGSTLFHLDDLPFKLEEMPANYGGFRDKVKNVKVRKTIEASDRLKGLPVSNEDIEPGRIPTLTDLGLNPISSQGGKPAANASLVGGETEALKKLKNFAAECQAKPTNKDGKKENIYGANFSCKISPWLAVGCLSPRYIFDEVKKTVSAVSASLKNGASSADTGTNWLMFELLWRDFFRFVTRKYSSAKSLSSTPATACAGAHA